jgi:PTS system nitrogen regulatory IIA component
MMLCHYLTPHNIVFLKEVKNKGEVLTRLVEELSKINQLKNVKYLTQAILDRERESSTFLPTGIAIPHARVPDVTEITLVMGVVPQGIKETPDVDSTHLVFLFFSPIKDKEFGRHLKLLAKIAAVFHDPAFVKEVATSLDADKIFALVQQKERETSVE